jgi:hypothetical protein
MIPKSLHTVTVFVNVATLLADVYNDATNHELVTLASSQLGYADVRDVYGLQAQAIKKLDKVRKVSPKLSLVA